MNRAQEEFLREWAETLDRHAADAAVREDRLIRKTAEVAEKLRLSEANSAYNRIIWEADKIVAKSGVTAEEARVEALRRHPDLYDAYVSGLQKAWTEDPLGEVDQRHAGRDLVVWAQRRLAAAPDAGSRNELLAELASHPEMREALAAARAADVSKAAREKREEAVRKEEERRLANYPTPLPDLFPVDGEWPTPRNAD